MNNKQLAIGFIIAGGIVFAIFNNQQKAKTPTIHVRKKLARGYNARTIPPFGIYVKESEKDNQELIEHELVHWKQYQENGLLNYYFTYIKQLKKYGYDRMPMEQVARGNESEYCKANYTECVRAGQSNTIYNPKFRTLTIT